MNTQGRQLPLETLRNAIADGLWTLSANDVPSTCTRLGLAEGTIEEAFRSKRQYVRSRIVSMSESELLALARAIIREYDIPALSDFVSELTTHAEFRITDLTRRTILEALDSVDELFGNSAVMDGLGTLAPNWQKASTYSLSFEATLASDVEQHYLRNRDLSNSQLLELCGALTCSQARFFSLLELVTSPLSRKGIEQEKLAQALNEPLAADGFELKVTGQMSRHPIYSVRRLLGGVKGAAKNLIFASVNVKPDLVFVDAINNDVAIVNDSDALIYDRFLQETGLTWVELNAWWADLQGLENNESSRRTLYLHLRDAVLSANSPGEYALFQTYYKHFVPLLAQDLPALIPQVYLHFDPRTAIQRDSNPVLARQRMDLLLLLDHGTRIVIEVDGKHHYAEGAHASPSRYGAMAAEDRKLRLQGYEVYRFGAAEFSDTARSERGWTVGPISEGLVVDFLERLFQKHPLRRTHTPNS
ncbi:hypothetical protein GQ57_27165 [Burkholderia sp. MSh2]|uniref:AbiJ-NTD3 domain-containing protein n=1 Tax=Burkholderia paludis TaxID=1506587 RepID=A0A6P2RMD7_9BURK|nr:MULTISPECIES: hypothetical protein [Burkholderia]KEZ02803.1 hypothetical protein GQ57_27165 [Burkholderia sp. MSh2]CAB3769712.1 hypothetical protein LMG30113_06046 [Burkholderia paludis]VWC34303.1 hypothetical protein BPA30113_06481 [Burkholderia paludis]